MQKVFILATLCVLVPSVSVGKTKHPDGVRPKDVCICGYNPRTECDGTYLHYISDCYDENSNYCGYDDQVPGDMCTGQGTMKRIRLKHPPNRNRGHL
jgi:hypothetical protein